MRRQADARTAEARNAEAGKHTEEKEQRAHETEGRGNRWHCDSLQFTDSESVSVRYLPTLSLFVKRNGETMTSQAERRAATVAAIISAAGLLFTARGFDAASIDDIAERAGVAKGAVYHHFESKEQIFVRV